MSNVYTVRGLPQSIARDGWWLTQTVGEQEFDESAPSVPHALGDVQKRYPKWQGLLILVLLGDFLLWGVQPALALVVFVWCTFAVAGLGHTRWRDMYKPALLLFAASLPALEYIQLLSVGFLLAGLLAALVWLKVIDAGRCDLWSSSLLNLAMRLPFSGMMSLVSYARKHQHSRGKRGLLFSEDVRLFLRNWSFPFGGALVLSALLISANPVIEQSVLQFFALDIDVFNITQKLMFWAGLALLIWPLLTVSLSAEPLDLALPGQTPAFGVNAGSVLRALCVFNVFLGIQSILDFSILMGGAALPDGMTYATYAHRGAYPLLVTAMLAGAFALAARPFLREHRAIKPLLMLWLCQNVMLCLSAVLRLDLYVAEYGLTYLRIYALIWMGLVTVGLLLIAWQILRARSSAWLLSRAIGLGLVTLYICAFVNFAAVIAVHTLDRAAERGTVHRTDWRYLCDLGGTARQTIREKLNEHSAVQVPRQYRACFAPTASTGNWREWSFRTRQHASVLDHVNKVQAGRWQVPDP